MRSFLICCTLIIGRSIYFLPLPVSFNRGDFIGPWDDDKTITSGIIIDLLSDVLVCYLPKIIPDPLEMVRVVPNGVMKVNFWCFSFNQVKSNSINTPNCVT